MNDISEKQLEANRQNAKLGGVKTDEGKDISKFNALKHGLLSTEVLLKDEDRESLEELSKDLRKEFQPATQFEWILVDRITANIWRLKRALKVESEMIDNELKDDMFGKKNVGRVFSYDLINYDTFGKFTRYESSIERSIYRALHELQRLQAARLGEKPPLPVAVDIDISKEGE